MEAAPELATRTARKARLPAAWRLSHGLRQSLIQRDIGVDGERLRLWAVPHDILPGRTGQMADGWLAFPALT